MVLLLPSFTAMVMKMMMMVIQLGVFPLHVFSVTSVMCLMSMILMTVPSRLPLTPHLTLCTTASEPQEDQTDLTAIIVKVRIDTMNMCVEGLISFHTVFGHWTDNCEYDMVGVYNVLYLVCNFLTNRVIKAQNCLQHVKWHFATVSCISIKTRVGQSTYPAHSIAGSIATLNCTKSCSYYLTTLSYADLQHAQLHHHVPAELVCSVSHRHVEQRIHNLQCQQAIFSNSTCIETTFSLISNRFVLLNALTDVQNSRSGDDHLQITLLFPNSGSVYWVAGELLCYSLCPIDLVVKSSMLQCLLPGKWTWLSGKIHLTAVPNTQHQWCQDFSCHSTYFQATVFL